MSPVIVAQPEAVAAVAAVDTTAPAAAAAASAAEVLADEVQEQIVAGLEEEQPIPPALLAGLFLVLGIVVFVAVIMKRTPSRPQMMQCAGHMKSRIYGYGSVNFLDELYEKEYGKWGFLRSKEVSMKTRPSSFVSVSEIWKAQHLKNQRQINKIVEEPEDDGNNWKIVKEFEGKR